jgi:hypothetical protein
VYFPVSKAVAVFLVALATSACATTYGPMSGDGGYTDLRVSEFVHRINVRGNENTTREMVQNFALLRASELTLASGRDRFVILGEDIATSSAFKSSGGSAATSDGWFGGTSTKYEAPQIDTITKAGGTMVIEIVAKDDPRHASAYDAGLIDRQLRPELERNWWQWN